MRDILSEIPGDTLIRLTSRNAQGRVVNYTVHRADYPAREVLGGTPYVWLSFKEDKKVA
jgi:hypothetical protein